MKITRLRNLLLAAPLVAALAASGCVVDNGSDHGGDACLPDLLVEWQIQDSSGAPLTCAQAGAASVEALVDGTTWWIPCPPHRSSGSIDVPLASKGTYNVAVNLLDQNNQTLAPQQTLSPPLDVETCGAVETTPAVLVAAAASSAQ